MASTLTNDQLKKIFETHKNSADIVIIDIREPNEYQKEHIPDGINVPIAQLEQYDFSKHFDKTVLVHCKSGMRTRSIKDHLEATGIKEIYCLEGGIEQWKKCGMKTLKNKDMPLEIMRQVQISAGFLILLGVFLSYFVHPVFIYLTIFVGAGLIFAGFTGFCGMAKLLLYMPWNKQI